MNAAANISAADLERAAQAEAKARAKEAEELRRAAKVSDSAALASWRRKATAAGSIMALSPKDRESYARAIFAANTAANKRAMEKGGAYGPGPARCASGTYANNFEDRRRAMQSQNAAQFARDVQADKDRRLEKCDWQAEYDAAMKAKAAEKARLAELERAAANLDKITVCFVAAPAPASTSTPQIIAPPLDLPAPANDRAKRQRRPRTAKTAPPAISDAEAFRARHAGRLEALQKPRRRA